MRNISLHTLEETRRLAESLASELKVGDAVLLEGNLGAGKTTFARYLIRSLINDEEATVTSPTFNLVQLYDMPGGGNVWHFDLYRIEHSRELLELGIEDAFQYGISIIEWPDRLGSWMPQTYKRITLTIMENETRQVNIEEVGQVRSASEG